MDASAENYQEWTPFNYCANNPIMLIDLDGRDWFYYKAENEEEASYHWHDGDRYELRYYTYSEAGDQLTNYIDLKGANAVVVFNGYWDEKLGNENNLYGEGAQLASVTVYGPGGKNDIQNYDGYTMSSDPTTYSVVGTSEGKGYGGEVQANPGPYDSHFLINENVPSVYFENNKNKNVGPLQNPNEILKGDPGYMDRIFIHRSNKDGYAGPVPGTAVTKGCLLIAPGRNSSMADWNRFSNQMSGISNFRVQVNRAFITYPYRLMK